MIQEPRFPLLERLSKSLIPISLAGLAFSVYSFIPKLNQIVQEDRNRQQTQTLCKKVIEKYDSNKDDYLSSEEGLKLVRDLGIKDPLPRNLRYNFYQAKKGEVGLNISSYADGEIRFCQDYKFPLLDLENMVN